MMLLNEQGSLQCSQRCEASSSSSLTTSPRDLQPALRIEEGQAPQNFPASPLGSQEAKNKRIVAADFITEMTGTEVPYSTDRAFRHALLKDGMLLCNLANAVSPGLVSQVVEAGDVEKGPNGLLQQRRQNISSFLNSIHKLVPPECTFSLPDIESEGWEERPRVVECILYLQQVYEANKAAFNSRQIAALSPSRPQISSPSSPGLNYSISYRSPRSSPLLEGYGSHSARSPVTTQQQLVQHTHGHHPANGLMPTRSSVYGDSLKNAQHKSVQAAQGVTRLMQQCSAMLKERMFVDAPRPPSRYSMSGGLPSPDHALEAMGPVLESVLGSLTQEYEKRLLLKDHELSDSRDKNTSLQKQVYSLQNELQRLRGDLGSQKDVVEAACAAAAEADCQRLQQRLHEMEVLLAEKDAALEELRAASDSSMKARVAQEAALNSQVSHYRQQLEDLANLDERYRRIVEDNRNLYNLVQDLRGNIRVFCRLRPAGATGDMSPTCTDVGMDGDLAVYDPARGDRKVFKVDRVFDETATQTGIYEDTQPLIRSVLDGYNVCIFAYGQTGSGKTHTMSGTNVHNPEGRGINYRALDDLFALRDVRSDEVEYHITVQMLEIYNETLRDLLVDGNSSNTSRLEILSTQASGCNVPGASKLEVHTSKHVEHIMSRGSANRHTSETKMNDRSSRSHQILTVIVDGQNTITGARIHGCLHLVDLAGSERVSKSEATGDRLIEAQHINRSLSALGDVMAALASKSQHIPFRNSKLTQLLQDSLCGQAKVMMFMHISPEANMFGETVSTLKFATRVSEITLGQAKRNVESGKVFEAHEQMTQYKETAATLNQQVQELTHAIKSERSMSANYAAERDCLARENQELRAQLEAAKKAVMLSQRQGSSSLRVPNPPLAAVTPEEAPATSSSPTQQEQATALSAQAGHGGADEELMDQSSGFNMERDQPEVPVSPSPLQQQPWAGVSPQDMTPTRDQYAMDTSPSASVKSTPRSAREQLSPMGSEASSLATPRSARQAREISSSSTRHIDRMNSARLRQSGVFSSSSNGARLKELAAGTTTGSNASHRPSISASAADSASSTSSSSSYSPMGVSKNKASSLRNPSTSGSIASIRPRVEASLPLTARVAGVAARARMQEQASSFATSRQKGTFRSTSVTSSAAAAFVNAIGGVGGKLGEAPPVSARGTARAGGRWK